MSASNTATDTDGSRENAKLQEISTGFNQVLQTLQSAREGPSSDIGRLNARALELISSFQSELQLVRAAQARAIPPPPLSLPEVFPTP